MKTTTPFAITLFVAACSGSNRPTGGPAPATTAETSTPRDPLAAPKVAMRQVDGLPITELVDPGADEQRPVQEAIAVLHPTRGNRVTGLVRFVNVAGRGVEVFATVEDLPNQTHAYHVHVYGDCSGAQAESAGPHFHFTGSSFDEEVGFITGNLGELRRDQRGQASTHRALLPNASLQGEFSLIGRAVVVHARGNDPEITPDGGAGARIACGVIGIANPRAPRTAAGR